MFSYGMDEGFRQTFDMIGILIPQVGIRVRAKTLRVVQLFMNFVMLKHIEYHQVDHTLFPTERFCGVNKLDALHIVIFDLLQGTFMGHEALASDIRGGVKLKEDQVRVSALKDFFDGFVIGKVFVRLSVGDAHQFNFIRGAFTVV